MESRRRSGALILLIFVCVSLCGTLASGLKHQPKNVQVALRAKWEGTPLLLEAGELLSRESQDLFWEFLELWIERERNDVDATTARQCLSKIIESGRSHLSKHLGSIFEFSLLLRSASPRLVLYRQLAGESLSSFPLSDDNASDAAIEDTLRSTEEARTKRVDPLYVGRNPKSPGGKCCWVDTGGSLFFDVSELSMWLQSANEKAGEPFQQPEHFAFDHLYLNANISSPVAVLYGAIGIDCFRDFHATLAKAAKEGKVQYVLRPVLPVGCETLTSSCAAVGTKDPVNLGGYGVELALKNMEYKAMDDSTVKKTVTLEDPHTEDLSQEIRGFIFSKILERKPELTPEIMAFRDNLLSFSVSDTLDVWELKDLGHQTAQKIVRASDPLQSMLEINQNFPSVVSSLSRMKLDDSVKDEILANQRMVPQGKSLMALNGALINIEDIDLYLLVDLVHQELSMADQMSKLKIPGPSIRELLSTLPNQESITFRIDFRSNHVHYLNNLEVDPMYKRWRSNVNEILMPAFPGQLRYIRKNLFSGVFVIDPASRCGLEAIDMVINFYENQFPIRLGVILYSTSVIEKIGSHASEHQLGANGAGSEEDISNLIIRLFLFIEDQHGIQMAIKFLSTVNRLYTESGDAGEDSLLRHQVEEAFIETVLAKSKSPPQDILLKLEREKNFSEMAIESSMFVLKLGLSNRDCCLLMNGILHDSNEDSVVSAINEELPRIQEQVYYGHISSETDVLDKFLSESGISRYNPQILTDGKIKPKMLSLYDAFVDKESFFNDIIYLHSSDTTDDVKSVTHIVFVDVTSETGIKFLREGIHYLIDGSERSRIGVLFGPPDLGADSPGQLFVKLFKIAASSYRKKGVLNLLDQLCTLYQEEFQTTSSLPGHGIQEFIDKLSAWANAYNLTHVGFKTVLSDSSGADLRNHLNKVAFFLYKHLGLGHKSNAVITNGRVIQVTEGSMFLSHDFLLLEMVELKRRVKQVAEIIESVKWQDMDPDAVTSEFISDVIMITSSSLGSRDRNAETARFEILQGDYSAVVLNDENSSIHIDAVVDPLSTAGQKLASLLQILCKYVQPSLRIVLNPLSSMVDLPLKNFYRYVVPSMDDFSNVDYVVNGPKAFFANMPPSKTLTMNLDVPEPWLVEPVIAVHDLDNILLENLGETRTLQAVFELEALVLTGHCFEKDHEPPRGLQMVLGTKSSPHLVDTLVMANLGYWQMKVSPGIWYLQLAPGRSSDLYVLREDGDSTRTSLSKRIITNDLRGKVVHLEVVKRKGKENEKLLSADDGNSNDANKESRKTWNKNLFKWASGLIGGSHQPKKSNDTMVGNTARKGKPINIFSIASGHLYERFLKIMILSVLKNTQRPVKFWFIKNYLSPQFKDVIPRMAEEYGFDYELITYKWPTWLHKQTEKQRIIWAYKILFLDVIFPLSLEKVIFVDADQIVRTDMGELYDMDIKGRPLAYTPFCDNNRDMDGYRFWRQGFWKEHLRGRPYHISALYVVDLAKFRQSAAGDTLRVFYETLSKDPNSLANLDQDLPNYAQHTVPIFSLPQEWLWCESWCGNVTKSKAKTIDLCNNPMTKEPKLQGARRIVSEWPDLDLEARRFTAKILGEDIEPLQMGISSDEGSQDKSNDRSQDESHYDSSKEESESREEL